MRRVTWEATLVAFAFGGSTGCSKLLGLDPPVLVGGDANEISDAPPIDADTCTTFATQFDSCALDFAMAVDIEVPTAGSYDTDTHLLVMGAVGVVPPHVIVTGPAGPIDVVIASAFDLEAGATFLVTGSVPFAVASTGAIEVDGTIDAEAGAQAPLACGLQGGRPGEGDNLGGGGAGGGAYQAAGGHGGTGDNGLAMYGAGGVMASVPAGLLGGCPGGQGGDSTITGAAPGAGGGAIDLVSAMSYTQDGNIQAGGGGGSGGMAPVAGGGGGGSGGMVLIEAPTVVISGKVAANGGGGGGGGGNTTAGQNGQAGQFGTIAAQGGPSASGGTGGDGGTSASPAGDSVLGMNPRGGGGGGGGIGLFGIAGSPTTSGTFSPAPIAWPPS